MSQSGQFATFKTLSGKDESFSFNIVVKKEGFEQKTTLTARVLAKKVLKIGDNAFGGFIFYIDSTGKHGLVCATTDQHTGAGAIWDASSNAQWNIDPKLINPTPTNSTGTAIGTGVVNTNKIIAVLGSNGVAASLCVNYRGGGYADWFLPSKDELKELYKSKDVVGGLTFGSFYWSSTEVMVSGYNYSCVWIQMYSNNQVFVDYDQKYDNGGLVRAVRAF